MDLCGPIKPPTLGGKSYFLLIFYDFSRFMWISLLSFKVEALQSFKKFRMMAKAEIKRKLNVQEVIVVENFCQKNLISFVKRMVF